MEEDSGLRTFGDRPMDELDGWLAGRMKARMDGRNGRGDFEAQCRRMRPSADKPVFLCTTILYLWPERDDIVYVVSIAFIGALT